MARKIPPSRKSVLEPSRLSGLRFQGRVQLDIVFGDFGQRVGRAKLHDQSSRVPGCARGQLIALEENDVAPPELGQVIGGAGAGYAASDDDDLGMFWQLVIHVVPQMLVLDEVVSRVGRSSDLSVVRQFETDGGLT